MDETRGRMDAETRGEKRNRRVHASPRLSVILVAVLLAAGCALKANRGGIPAQAQATVDAVTADIAVGRYDKIYEEAAEEWRQAATPEQSDATFKKLKERLGNPKSRAYHSATEQDGTGGHSFIITYTTSFERAEGMETFTLVEREGRWLLARYFVNSDALK
jgi:Protein of unknown function (DUF4019)